MKITVAGLGRVDYQDALIIQEKLHELRVNNRIGDILLLLEHPPVITLGKRGLYSNILLPCNELIANNVPIYTTNRGGDVTYHGPGQIVGYPIMSLDSSGNDIRKFIWNMEEIFIKMLQEEFGVAAYRDDKKYTGVWVGDQKITAIGLAVKSRITMHGFAFNVNTDLEHFKWIKPCGITDKGVTSLQKICGRSLNLDTMNMMVIKYFCAVFNLEPYEIAKNDLYRLLTKKAS